MHYASEIELWARKSSDQRVPVHELAMLLGPDDCKLQLHIYSLSDKDDSCFLYGIGKTNITM